MVNSKPKPLTYTQREERRQKGLCYYCDEKFSKGHECKNPQNFLMVADMGTEFVEYEEEPKYDVYPEDVEDVCQEEVAMLSALSLTEPKLISPLQFKGLLKGGVVKLLVDSGSTMNLISKELSQEMGLHEQELEPVCINLPNGDILKCESSCKEFQWKLDEVQFNTEVVIADLKEWDIIMGVQWLGQLGDLVCNYNDHTLQFNWQGRTVELTADSQLFLEESCYQLTAIVPTWKEQLIDSYSGDTEVQNIIATVAIDKSGPQQYYITEGLLQYQGKWVVGRHGNLRKQIFEELHSNGIGGHSGIKATVKRIGDYFSWTTIKQDIGRWVRECAVCQETKGENMKKPGLLQPLAIPQVPWREIAMDFITGLPKSQGFEVIWVVVDRFSRYAHFVALQHPISAKGLAQTFFDNIYKLHGLPESIVSDRDSLFLSEFWQNLFKICGTRLCMSTAYHPQSDGCTERVNQCLEQYLRGMSSQVPKKWAGWLSAAEWWYNTTFHSTLQTTPFQVVYGVHPRHLPGVERGHTNISTLEEMLANKQQQWSALKEILEAAQVRMKAFADKNRSERVFVVGDWVYLKLQPYRQVTVAIRKNLKLSAKFFGPYKVLERVGTVAYRLDLPTTSRVHPVFHVSQLKKAVGQAKVHRQLPHVNSQGTFEISPLRKLDSRNLIKDHKVVYQALIQWKGCSVDEATWEDEELLKLNFPDFAFDP